MTAIHSADGAGQGDEFERAFGEPLRHTLDLNTWKQGEDLASLYVRLEREVAEALAQEDQATAYIRAKVLPALAARPSAPPFAGHFRVTTEQVERVHRGLLFTGAVEACDGASAVLDTVPVTIAQVGVGLVSYQGDQGTWVQRLYRRDLRIADTDPAEEALALLEARQQQDHTRSSRAQLNQLARRGIMTYAERAALVHCSRARWRIGHGTPAPLELLTGSGSRELLAASLEVLEQLILGHRRFLFVPSAPPDRAILTLGGALAPLEFAIVDTQQSRLEQMVGRSGSVGPVLSKHVREFIHEVGSKIALGVFRAARVAPPYLFFSHIDVAHEAALIAIADSTLQEHRGFPLLIDIADAVCKAAFGGAIFDATARAVYAAHGAPYRYLGERETRK